MIKVFALTMTAALLASGCGLNGLGFNSTTKNQLTAKRKLPANAKKWTILMHVAADNNLYTFGLEDLNEMEAGINMDDTNVIVMFDGQTVGDSAVYEIQRDSAGKNTKLVSVANTNVPFIPANHEVNSGDPNLLKAFGEWAIAKYPAEHYGLGIWDHGSGIFKKGAYQSTEFFYKGFGWDDNSGGHMSTKDLSTIMPALAAAAGQPIDMLGFDACLMSHVELAYQVKGSVNYLVASEELEPGPGWDYVNWLKNVNGSSTPVQMASALVDSYGKSYLPGGSQNPGNRPQEVTLAASDVNDLTTNLVPAINDLSKALIAALPADKSKIATVRSTTQSFYNRDCADLGSFVKLLASSGVSSDVKSAALNVQNAIASTVVRETHSGKAAVQAVANASGLVIYFPNAGSSYNAKYDDKNAIAFAAESWKDFLKAFLAK